MSPKFLPISFFCLMAIIVHGQTTQISFDSDFYRQLGIKDAKFELKVDFLNGEDESDFWIDQIRFESQLAKEDDTAYQVYLTAKYEVYHAHQLCCTDLEARSLLSQQKMDFYLNRGKVSLPSAVMAVNDKGGSSHSKN